MSKEDWACMVCFFFNPWTALRCGMCKEAKGAKKGDW